MLTGATAGVAVAVNFGAANARVPSGAGVLSPAVLETVDTVVTTTPAPTTNVRTAPVSTHVPDDDGHDDDGNESDEDDSDRDHNGGRSEKGEEHEEYEGRDDDD